MSISSYNGNAEQFSSKAVKNAVNLIFKTLQVPRQLHSGEDFRNSFHCQQNIKQNEKERNSSFSCDIFCIYMCISLSLSALVRPMLGKIIAQLESKQVRCYQDCVKTSGLFAKILFFNFLSQRFPTALGHLFKSNAIFPKVNKVWQFFF